MTILRKRRRILFSLVVVIIILTAFAIAYIFVRSESPITSVKDGSFEYNWSSNQFLNASNYVESSWTGTPHLTINETHNRSSSMISEIDGFAWVDLDFGPTFEFGVNISGNLTSDLQAKGLEVVLNSSLPNNRSGDGVSSRILCEINVSGSGWGDTRTGNLQLVNQSKVNNTNYHFFVEFALDVEVFQIKANITYPFQILISLTGLGKTAYILYNINVRDT